MQNSSEREEMRPETPALNPAGFAAIWEIANRVYERYYPPTGEEAPQRTQRSTVS